MESLTCPKCGGPRESKALYCPFCGALFNRPESTGRSAARTTPPPPAYAGASPAPASTGVPPAPAYAGASAIPAYAPAAPANVPAAPAYTPAAPAYTPAAPAHAGAPAAAPVSADVNPYRPPAAPIALRPVPTPQAAAAPEAVLSKIRNGWIAAVISGSVTLLFIAIAAKTDIGIPLDSWSLIDVALIFGLAYGISRKSRVCSTAMLVYFLASKVYIWTAMKSAKGVWMALVFIYYFFQAMVATFEYHRLQKS